eukprot:TRINITY_DN43541_c0_g1_i1.p2 TRINITY_DN43541_c0_g1~~TRINITY_DN43541_c0_g1_i1.p2  ORF type:complete len:104 (+),score=16.55 TRINITY_DN43541_c0_g1_i1:82-393(+)
MGEMGVAPFSLAQLTEGIGLTDRDMVNVYVVGSRMWGTASASSDWDLVVVVRGDRPKSATKLRCCGLVDAQVMGDNEFVERLGRHEFMAVSYTHLTLPTKRVV